MEELSNCMNGLLVDCNVDCILDGLVEKMDKLKTVSPQEEFNLLVAAINRDGYTVEDWEQDCVRYRRYNATMRLKEDDYLVIAWIRDFLECKHGTLEFYKNVSRRIDYYLWENC
jgi:hypothetical protein